MRVLFLILFLIGCGSDIKTEDERLKDYCQQNFLRANHFLSIGDKREFDLTECMVYSRGCVFKCSMEPLDLNMCKEAANKQESKCRIVN